ncbi:MAG: hypothetical protein JXB36_08760 [Gammaproteobacteria bacterium]|nr:hypothetical protein [Gammaproteobacteria bacterium]
MELDTEQRRMLVRYLVCWGVLLASLVLFPTLAWVLLPGRWLPDAVGQTLLFWPQYLFVPHGLTHEATLGERTYLSGAAVFAAAAFWLLALGAYVYLTRRRRAALTYVLLLPTVLIVLIAVLGLLGLFGVGIVLDGP